MSAQAKVLYDFVPQEDGDLAISCDEIVTLIEANCGNGWARAKNQMGKTGIIPANYVEVINIPEPSIPPPPVPFSKPFVNKDTTEYAQMAVMPQDKDDEDYDEDFDWESDSDNGTTHQSAGRVPGFNPVISTNNNIVNPRNSTISNRTSVSSSYGDNKVGLIRMPKGFMRSGGESVLLGTTPKVDESKMECEIIMNAVECRELYKWKESTEQRYARITEHTKSTKFRGLKSFVEYKIENSFSREGFIIHRYKQFDWLHKQMCEKYPCLVIPPLPIPKVVGRFEEEFVECRQKGLQRWLDYIVRHPVLSESNLLRHFMSVADKKDWTKGKRALEDDEYKGAKFFLTVKTCDVEVMWDEYSKRLTRIMNFQDSFKNNFRDFGDNLANHKKKQQDQVHRLYKKLGGSLTALSQSNSLFPDNNAMDIHLLHGIQKAGDSFEKVGKLFREESEKMGESEEQIEDLMGVTYEVSPLLDLAKSAVTSVEGGYKRSSETKVNLETIETIDRNMRGVVQVVDAELSWLQQHRQQHLRQLMHGFLSNQVEMFQNITQILTEARDAFSP